jgi:hypothetical protein
LSINKSYWYEARVNDTEIAQTILFQLGTKPMWLLSWGSHNYVNMGDGLKFNVRGRTFRGQIIIKLNADDTYNILFGKIINNEWILKKIYENVYCDQLHELIDEYVEYGVNKDE